MAARTGRIFLIVAGFPLVFFLAACGHSAAGSFRVLGQVRGLGTVSASIVAGGPRPRTHRVYESMAYPLSTFEVVDVDPGSGATTVIRSPVPGEQAAWALARADGDVWLGTAPHAHLLRLDPRTATLTDLGRPVPTERYIWGLTASGDGDLYGCTYPHGKLFRYSPRTAKAVDLGQADPDEQYGRSCVSRGDFVYVGLGTRHAQLDAYSIRSGTFRVLARTTAPGTARVFQGRGGRVYGILAPGRAYLLRSGGARRVPAAEASPVAAPIVRAHVAGQPLGISRLAPGPNPGELYASTALPGWLVRIEPARDRLEKLGVAARGEVDSLLPHGRDLLLASYIGPEPLAVYEPSRAFSPTNPRPVPLSGQSTWRPIAMVAARDGRVYVGSAPPYGQPSGAITAWDVARGRALQFEPVQGQSVVSLAPLGGGLLLGGTSNSGGSGTAPSGAAEVFLWDARRSAIVWAEPVRGGRAVPDLVVSGGVAYGFATGAGSTRLVRIDVRAHTLSTRATPCVGPVRESAALIPGKGIYALMRDAICRIDPADGTSSVVAQTPAPATAGFALMGGSLYYASGANVWQYVP